jgi:dTDP-4-dehydrorhamnose reductase
MKILLFGKSGQVGWELQRSLAPMGELVALDTRSAEPCGDLSCLDGIRDTVCAVAPDVVVNAAAYTAVDAAESERERAHTINALAPAILACESRKLGAWLIHYSSDYVFDGSGCEPWLESDTPAPLSVYGSTKLEAERSILASGCNHIIFRTSWVFALHGKNFAKTMLRLARERESVSVINDQVGAPTGADLIADVTAHAIGAALCRRQDVGGLYHLAAAGETSWYGYACFLLNVAGQAEAGLKLASENIFPVPSSAFPLPAHRPRNSRLNTTKLQNTFNLMLPSWQTGVVRLVSEILDKS